ncbi:hypothetical protein VTH82DRAFT_3932 [Thermothelomyces myriococcoides]
MKKGCLDPSITFQNATRAVVPPKSVIITGATDFVGAFITRELLELHVAVYCLVRADGKKQAMQCLVTTFADYGLWKPNAFDDLADRVDAICHSGALVNWIRPLEDLVGPNIVTTHEALRLASHGRAKSVLSEPEG